MKEEEINQKIDAALTSLDDLKKAETDDALLGNIMQRIDNQRLRVQKMVPMQTVWLAAASFALIVVFNISSLIFKSRDDRDGKFSVSTEHSAARSLAQTYFTPNGQ